MKKELFVGIIVVETLLIVGLISFLSTKGLPKKNHYLKNEYLVYYSSPKKD